MQEVENLYEDHAIKMQFHKECETVIEKYLAPLCSLNYTITMQLAAGCVFYISAQCNRDLTNLDRDVEEFQTSCHKNVGITTTMQSPIAQLAFF